MLTIKIIPQAQTYLIKVFKGRKLLTTREFETTDQLEIFERLEAILKCCPEVKIG